MTEEEEIVAAVNALQKPRRGDPCNGCGFCCALEVCEVGLPVFGPATPCPAMEWDGVRFNCGMMLHQSRYTGLPEYGDDVLGPLFAALLGAGKGCCSDDPDPISG